MRWLVFAVTGVLAVALDTSFMPGLLRVRAVGDLYPSLVGVLVVYVALFAPRQTGLWAAWAIGLLLDLGLTRAQGVVIGPHALGFVFGAYLVMQVRTMVFRRRVLTLALLTVLCLAAAAVVEVALFTVRSWFDPAPMLEGYRPLAELARGGGMAVYSGLLAVPVGWLLLRSHAMWGFLNLPERRAAWR